MTTILTTAGLILTLVAAFALLVAYARRDAFASTRNVMRDELGFTRQPRLI